MSKHTGFFSVIVLLLASNPCFSQQPNPWIGVKVVTKYTGDPGAVVHIYTVEQNKGDWLWVVDGGWKGWIWTNYVIPFDQAIDFYTNEIRANPSNCGAYVERGSIWEAKKEFDVAIADFNEAIRLNPKYALAYMSRGNVWRHKRDFGKAIADFDKAIRLDPKYAEAHHGRALIWATCPNAKYRDGKKAVESATRACELSEWREATKIGTLAAAYAEVGDFGKAVETQEKAIKLLSDDATKKDFGDRLKLYKDKKPYRDTE